MAKAKTKTQVINPLTGKRESHIIKTYPGRPKWCEDINELWTQMELYVEFQLKAVKPMTMAGLAAFLKVSKETLNVYRRGEYDEDDTKYSEAIEVVRTIIEANKLEGGLEKLYDASITKFDLVNNHGYKDKVVQEHTGEGGGPIKTEDMSDLEFARRFLWMLHKSNKEKEGEENEQHSS